MNLAQLLKPIGGVGRIEGFSMLPNTRPANEATAPMHIPIRRIGAILKSEYRLVTYLSVRF
jgi:hypothetical protein